MEQSKKYYAFISYKSEDVEWAMWLQHELEHYRLPASFNGRTDIRQELRPVFRDIDELSAGNLPEQIKQALENSQNLIVVCSPQAATSHWVNQEVETFISLGRTDRIFPFIVEGNSPKEFFPPSLLALPENEERLGGDASKQGRDVAFVKVVAGMLGLGFDDLWNRYEREKAEEERKQREQRDKLLIAQSRFVAEKAVKLIKDKDCYLARRLAINILPNPDVPERPKTVEAEALLRKASEKDNAIFKGHTHPVSIIKSIISFDKKTIFSLAIDGYLYAWDVSSGKLLFREKKQDGWTESMCINPDGTRLATASHDKTVLVWDISNPHNPKPIGTPILHSAPVSQIEYTNDGNYIISGLSNGNICIISKNEIISEIQDNNNLDYKDIEGLSISRDNRVFVLTWESIHIWDFQEGSLMYNGNISVAIGKPLPMKFSPDGEYMVSVSNKDIYIWGMNTFNPKTRTYELIIKQPLSHEDDIITAVDISSDSRHIAVGVGEKLYIWDCKFHNNYYQSEWVKNEPIKFNAIICHIAFFRGKDALIVSFNNMEVRLVDLSPIKPISLPYQADAIDFCIDNDKIVLVSENSYAPKIISMRDFTILSQSKYDSVLYGIIPQHHNVIQFGENDDVLYTLSDYHLIKWNSPNVNISKTEIMVEKISHYSCCNKTISKNGLRAAYAYKDGTIFLVNAQDGKIIKRLEPPFGRTLYRYISFSLDSKFLVTISRDGDAKMWTASDGEMCCKLPAPSTITVNSIEFSGDGSMIISATQEKSVILWKWNYEKKQSVLMPPLIGHNERVVHASLNNDGSLAVSASLNKIIIWHVETCTILQEIDFVCNKKFVRFSRDSRKVFASDGISLYVWTFPTLQELINKTWERFNNNPLTPEERKQYYLE